MTPVHVHMVCHDGKQGSSYGLAGILTKVVCRRFNVGKKDMTFSFILYIVFISDLQKQWKLISYFDNFLHEANPYITIPSSAMMISC